MKLRLFPPFLWMVPLAMLTGCSNDALQERVDGYNDAYSKLQERREIRQDARDARYDAWWDRVMD